MTLNVRAREPAVEAESEVEPALLPRREAWECATSRLVPH